MQLDRTHVVIRLRTMSEIGDLALVMIRRYPQSLLVGFVAGALPWAIGNLLLLGWIPITEASFGLNDEEAMPEIARYIAWMTLLVVLQAPAAGAATTYYLGQAVFEHRPTWRSVFGEVRRNFGRWFWVLGIQRLAVPAMVVVAFRLGSTAHGFYDVLVPIMLVIALCIFRSARPFMPEILLLEQCPIRDKNDSAITVSRRSKSLHSPVASDLGGRFFAVGFVFFWLLLSVIYTLIWMRGIVTGTWTTDLVVLLVIYPLALWTVAGFSVLVRLLSYLDTRIRLEGWEVELAIRAEAMRQFGEDAGWAQPSHDQPVGGIPADRASRLAGAAAPAIPTEPAGAEAR